MQSIRDRVSAAMNLERYKVKSIREHIASGETDYETQARQCRFASPSTVRKWRRTHEAREAGWIK